MTVKQDPAAHGKWLEAVEHRKAGRHTEAEAVLKDALERTPDHPLLQISLAQVYVHRNRLLEAKMLAEAVLARRPRHPQALFVLGQIASRENSLSAALVNFRQAAVKDGRPYIRVRIARTLKKMGRFEEALEELDAVLSTTPGDVGCLKEKAIILNKAGRVEEALDIYGKIAKLDPEDSFSRKEIYRLKGMERPCDQVISELRTVTKMDSRKADPQLHGLLGQKLKDCGRHEDAAREFQIASELDPGNPYFKKQAGYSLYRSGDHEAALRHFKEAFRKDPHDYRLRAAIGKIFAERSDMEGFAAFLEEVHRQNPANVKLIGVMNRIRKQLYGNDT